MGAPPPGSRTPTTTAARSRTAWPPAISETPPGRSTSTAPGCCGPVRSRRSAGCWPVWARSPAPTWVARSWPAGARSSPVATPRPSSGSASCWDWSPPDSRRPRRCASTSSWRPVTSPARSTWPGLCCLRACVTVARRSWPPPWAPRTAGPAWSTRPAPPSRSRWPEPTLRRTGRPKPCPSSTGASSSWSTAHRPPPTGPRRQRSTRLSASAWPATTASHRPSPSAPAPARERPRRARTSPTPWPAPAARPRPSPSASSSPCAATRSSTWVTLPVPRCSRRPGRCSTAARTPALVEQLTDRELYVSINTVRTHCRAIYRKLGVGDRHAAVQAARDHRLI